MAFLDYIGIILVSICVLGWAVSMIALAESLKAEGGRGQ